MNNCELCNRAKEFKTMTAEQKITFENFGLGYLSAWTYACKCPEFYLDDLVWIRDNNRHIDNAEFCALKNIVKELAYSDSMKKKLYVKQQYKRMTRKEEEELQDEIKQAEKEYNGLYHNKWNLLNNLKKIDV